MSLLQQKVEYDLKNAMRQKDKLRVLTLRMFLAALHNRVIEKRSKPRPLITEHSTSPQNNIGDNPAPRAQDISKERGKTGNEKLSEEEALAVMRSEVKKRKDSIQEFGKGGRQDLVDKESAELKILEGYLPAEMSDEELDKIVKKAIDDTGSAGVKDFGKIMGLVMKETRGLALGDRVNAMVKKFLAK